MSSENLAKMFQRFQQSEATRQKARGIQGTGLGLSIVKEALDAIGATIAVASERCKGTRFSIQLKTVPR